MQWTIRRMARVTGLALVVATVVVGAGCSTAPKIENRAAFEEESAAALRWFESNVPGLEGQIDRSAAYIVFPSVGQWGFLFTGGKFGHGMLKRSDGTQVGWAAVNTGSLGLQVGVQGFKMLLVLEDEATLQGFRENQLSGSVSGVVVVGEEGGSRLGSFENGVAVYQGANTGLMAGVNIGLDYLRYEPLGN